MRGWIFDIQRCSVHDGPGIRTTVFLKGCPLTCAWCHNPEGISASAQLSFLPARCLACGGCVRVCRRNVHRLNDGRHEMDRHRCGLCGACARACPAGALEIVGREAGVEEVLDEVMQDKPFYDTSGGGMTLSGGEPLVQIAFAEALLKGAKAQGLHCCIETSGCAEPDRLERLLPYVDLFLYDIKETDPERHLALTGASNELVLRNLRLLHERGAAALLRLPIIPGLNDRPNHFEAVAALCREMPGLLGAEIMPYHRLGAGKLDRLGLPRREDLVMTPPEAEQIEEWRARLRALGVRAVGG